MDVPCDPMRCCSGGGGGGGTLVLDDCGSAMCSVSGRPRFYHLPLTYEAAVCDYTRFVYSEMVEVHTWILTGNSSDPDDLCFREPGAVTEVGFQITTATPDPYCVDMSSVRLDIGNQQMMSCLDLTYDGPEVLTADFKDSTYWYRSWSSTASGGAVGVSRVVIFQLFGPIDLEESIPCALESGFATAYKRGCGGAIELVSREPIDQINLIGRGVSNGAAISGFARRPYKILEMTTVGHCPVVTETKCQDFSTPADQVDCISISSAPLTSVSVQAGTC